jgi:hypothetical protein
MGILAHLDCLFSCFRILSVFKPEIGIAVVFHQGKSGNEDGPTVWRLKIQAMEKGYRKMIMKRSVA